MKSFDSKKLIKMCELELKKGTNEQTVICYLKALELSILDTIKIIRKAKNVDLGEAKRLVSSNKCWSDDLDDIVTFNEKILEQLRKEYDVKILPNSIEISIDLN